MLAITFAKSATARWLRVTLAALILLTGIAVSGIAPAHRAAASSAITTSDLNLRAGPSTGNYVKLIMPPNASVTLLSGLGRSGFYKVSYGGETGYAHADFLSVNGSGSNSVDAGWSSAGSSNTTSALNLRSGPGTGYDVRLIMPYGAALTLTGASDSGFVGVIYNGTNGWASEQYLAQTGQLTDISGGSGETAYTTSNLNLRSGPSIADPVLAVMPGSTEVTLTGDEAGWLALGLVPGNRRVGSEFLSLRYQADIRRHNHDRLGWQCRGHHLRCRRQIRPEWRCPSRGGSMRIRPGSERSQLVLRCVWSLPVHARNMGGYSFRQSEHFRSGCECRGRCLDVVRWTSRRVVLLARKTFG